MKARSSLSLIRAVRIFAALSVVALAGACGSSSNNPPAADTITISNYSFSPTNLSVAPGAAVTVVNTDSVSHSVTSQSVTGAFVSGAVAGVSFDTGVFSGTRTFVISSSAAVGTVIPYFCSNHTSMMGQGQITVAAP